MPFMSRGKRNYKKELQWEHKKTCTKCGEDKGISEFSPRKDRNGKTLSACKSCRAEFYQTKRPKSTRMKHNSREDSLRWNKAKRDERTKKAFILKEDEFNSLVFSEAHRLRKLRNIYTGIVWEVDHIVPLQNNQVCGLHYWGNLQVITQTENRRKHNAFYD